jgi:hypothetical protein
MHLIEVCPQFIASLLYLVLTPMGRRLPRLHIVSAGRMRGGGSPVWCKLGPCWFGMLVLVQRCLDVARHGEVNIFVDIAPLECDATIRAVRSINGDLICVLKGVDEILGIITAHIPAIKVFHHNIKCDGACGMHPKAWSEWCLMVPIEGQPSREEVVGEYAGMGRQCMPFCSYM